MPLQTVNLRGGVGDDMPRSTEETISRAEAIDGVESIIGYQFKDASLLWEAVQTPHSGVYFAGSQQISLAGNRRLALVGNAWLRTIVMTDWYPTGLSTADATRMCCTVLSNENLNRVGRFYRLERFIQGMHLGRKRMADVVEAIIGAVAEDTGGNMKVLREVMDRIGLIPQIDASGQLQGIVHLWDSVD